MGRSGALTSGSELHCTEITVTPNPLLTGSGDTAFRDLAGWTLPATPAQAAPYLLRLHLPAFQTGAVINVTFQVVDASIAVGTAASAANCWIDVVAFPGVAFGTLPLTYEKRIAPGVALPALKLRYKASANSNNGAVINAGADGTYGRLEQIAR